MPKLALLLILSSCGTGSTVNVAGAPISQVAKLNSGKVFGYYGDCTISCFSEYQSSVIFYHSAPWSHDWPAIADGLVHAENAGKQIILSIPDNDAYQLDCDTRIRSFLTYLDSQNLLKNIYAIYPKDEPNLNGKIPEAQILAANSCVRNAIANYEGTRGKPLLATYSCSDPWVALEDFDIIACDDYEIGDLMLTKYLPALKKYGKPILLVSGGACPWNYNPYAMVVAANSDDQIIGLIAFLWVDGYNSPTFNLCGIKSSVTLPLYQALLGQPH